MQCENVNADGRRCCFAAGHRDDHRFAEGREDLSHEIRLRRAIDVREDEIQKLQTANDAFHAAAFAMLAAIAFVNDECAIADLRTAVAEYLEQNDQALEVWLDAHHAYCDKLNAAEATKGT